MANPKCDVIEGLEREWRDALCKKDMERLESLVHRDFAQHLKSARIWGTGVYDGQSVGREHVLYDKDVVELHV